MAPMTVPMGIWSVFSQLVRGYSRDHRPELNQVILELICENQAGLPVYIRALSGNEMTPKFAQTVVAI